MSAPRMETCAACRQPGLTERGLKAHKGSGVCLRRWIRNVKRWEMTDNRRNK